MRIALLITGLVVVVLAAALGGFLAGDVLAEDDTKRQVEEAEQRGYSEGFGAGLATGEAQAREQCDVIVGMNKYDTRTGTTYAYVIRTPQGGAYELDRTQVSRQFSAKGRKAEVGAKIPPGCGEQK